MFLAGDARMASLLRERILYVPWSGAILRTLSVQLRVSQPVVWSPEAIGG